jgi:hypothetical protein
VRRPLLFGWTTLLVNTLYILDNHGPWTNGTGNVAYDPGGHTASWRPGVRSDFETGNEANSFEAFTLPGVGEKPTFRTFNTTPEEEAQIIKNIQDYGVNYPKFFCASGVSDVIRGVGPFMNLPSWLWASPHGLGNDLDALKIPYSTQPPGRGSGPYGSRLQ